MAPVGNADPRRLGGDGQWQRYSRPISRAGMGLSRPAACAARSSPALRNADYDTGLCTGHQRGPGRGCEDPLSRGGYDGDRALRIPGTVSAKTGPGHAGNRPDRRRGRISDGRCGADRSQGRIPMPWRWMTRAPRFYRDPRDGRAVINLFALRSPVPAHRSNYAKFVYTSPQLFGADDWRVSFTHRPKASSCRS